jgi:serine/threonine-protein kinase
VVLPPGPPDQRSRRRRNRRRGLLAVGIVLVLGVAAGLAGWWFASGRYAHVPSVAGLARGSAVQRLHDAGFDFDGVTRSTYSETVPRHHVISARPSAGSRHVHGSKVTLVLSLGPQRIAVPHVRGMSLRKAESAIEAQGLTVDTAPRRKHSTKVAVGTVISSAPKVGTKIKKSRPVTLSVSLGPPKIEVPEIDRGTPYHEAVRILKRAHFTPKRGDDRYSREVGKGKVIALSPTGRVTEFSTITLTVSKGPRMVTIPNGVHPGMSTDQLTAQLEALQLDVQVDPLVPGLPTDHVYKLDPAPGQSVPVGSRVTIKAY